MKINKMIGIFLTCILLVVIVAGTMYYFRNRQTYELDLPEKESVIKVALEQNGMEVIIDDKENFDKIMNTIYGVKRITEEESVQDIPSAKDKIIIHFYLGEGNYGTTYLYKKGFGYYIEQPYNGIYKISKEEYETIENYMVKEEGLQ